MKKWQNALEKFLAPYKADPQVLGAILCGSHSTGNADENSDIDIHIIAKDQDWRERGNVIIDDVLIEYFLNPISKSYAYLEDDFKSRSICDANMYGNGTILFDKDGSVKKLQEDAKQYYTRDFSEPEDFKIALNNYGAWDALDELESAVARGVGADLAYYNLLQKLLDAYYYKNQLAMIPLTKLERIYRDGDYCKKYHVKNMPSQEFINLFLNCIDNKTIEAARRLYEFVCPDFKIEDFKLRSKVS